MSNWSRMLDTRHLFGGVLLVWMAGACTVGPDYRKPEPSAPTAWVGASDGNAATQPSCPTTRPAQLTEWWKSFNDPMLDSLIDRATRSNLDLRLATIRVVEARAARGVVAADLWPQVGLGASYAYRGSSLNTKPKTEGGLSPAKQVRNAVVNAAVRKLTSGNADATPTALLGQAVQTAVSRSLEGDGVTTARDQNLFQAGFDASWELDIFGGTRRAVEAAEADVAAAEEARGTVLVTLLSEVAVNYAQLRGFQRRLNIAQENIRLQQDTLTLTQQRFGSGFASKLEIAQARTQLASTQSQVGLLRTAVDQTIFQLSLLLGQPPSALTAELQTHAPIPPIPPEVPVGLPSDLLRRRPDIRDAERQLAAATARVGVATADLFPRFSLTGSIGPQSRTINHMMDWQSMGWSVGPGVSWPIFDGWRIRSNIEVQNARQEQALTIYEQTVLISFREVEDALTAYSNERMRCRSLAEAVEASRESTTLSNELYRAGWKDFLNVLEAQRTLYASQDQFVQSQTAIVLDLISLYKALGGGWEPGEPPPSKS